MTITWALSLVILCLVAQGAYSGAEIATASADRGALREQAEAGDAGAALALELLGQEDRLLGTCLVGSILSIVTGTVLVAWALTEQGIGSPWIAAAAYLPFAFVLGDAVPKQIHRTWATTLAPWSARFVRVSQVVFVPLLPLVRAYAALLARFTGSHRRDTLTRQEILWLLQEPAGGSDIDPQQHQMIQRVFQITETTAVETMTPLVDVDAVSIDATVKEAVDVAVRNGHTRLPVYEERVDHIVGVLHVRDLLPGAADDAPTRQLVKPTKYVPEQKRIDVLLQEMRREREAFTVVVDEYGGSVGILTIEDLLEEIFGEIHDERDRDDAGIRRISDTEWRVSARVSIEVLEKAIGRGLPEGDFETAGGLVLSVLGRIPRKGEIVALDGMSFRVDEANERAIQTLTITTPKGPRKR